MSAKQALAAARRRRGTATSTVNQSINQPVKSPDNRNNQVAANSKININQYVVFLNNKIETIENRVNETLVRLEAKINNEISKMENTPLGLNVTTLEQAMETQKVKINKMNSVINDIQNNYLVLNTSLLSMKHVVKTEMMDGASQTEKEETPQMMNDFRRTSLTHVPIMEEEEEEGEEEEEEGDDLVVPNEAKMGLDVTEKDIQPEPNMEQEGLHLDLSEKS